MHGLSDHLHPPEGEGQVGQATTHSDPGQRLLQVERKGTDQLSLLPSGRAFTLKLYLHHTSGKAFVLLIHKCCILCY